MSVKIVNDQAKKDIADLYLTEHLSQVGLAEMYQVSARTIARVLTELEVLIPNRKKVSNDSLQA